MHAPKPDPTTRHDNALKTGSDSAPKSDSVPYVNENRVLSGSNTRQVSYA